MKRAKQTLAAPLLDGRVQVWAVRDDGSVWTTWQQNANQADWILFTDRWAETPSFRVQSAAVAPVFGGRLQFWAVDSEGAIWSTTARQRPSDTWAPWTDRWAARRPSFRSESIAAAPLSDGRLQVWAVDSEGRIHSCWQKERGTRGEWTAWRKNWTRRSHTFRAVCTTAAPLSDGRLRFWAIDADGAIWSCTKESADSSAKWNDWTNGWAGGAQAFRAVRVAAVLLSDGCLQVWAVGEDGAIRSCRMTSDAPSSTWTAWTEEWAAETSPFEAISICAAPWEDGGPQLLTVNAEGDLWTCRRSGDDWTAYCLLFPLERQERRMWCWVATAASVAHFYEPTFSIRQCELIEQVVPTARCCGDPVDAICDLPGEVRDALDHMGNAGDGSPQWLTEERLAAEIRRGRPMIARMMWNGVSPHYVVVIGCGANHMVHVKDPWLGDDYVSYDVLRSGYAADYARGGRWIDTQCTKPSDGE